MNSKKKLKLLQIMPYICTHIFGVWRSWLAHLLWEQGVEGSSPFTPTEYQAVTVSVAAFVFLADLGYDNIVT